jgi:hypothetical protein
MSLKRPNPFGRRGRRLPGQSSDEELGLERGLTIKVIGQAAVIDWELIQIGDVSKGDYIELGPNGISIYNEGTKLEIWADVDGNQAQSELRIAGVDASDPDAYIGLFATTYNGSAQNSFTLDTVSDLATLDARLFVIGQSIRLAAVTTTERNALPQVNGTIVYNSTAGKFQGRAAGAWVDLH